VRDENGVFWYQARSDDMIVSAGYNISGPEVEAVLLTHPDVNECGVVAAPDSERGNIVKAYVVLKDGAADDEARVKALQDYVKNAIAPYKYPRAIEFMSALPRTPSGKLQRNELRKRASAPPATLTEQRSVLPEGWPKPRGYANAIVAEGRQIFIGGQIGWDAKGAFSDSFVGQLEQTLRNIEACLAAAGARPEHLVRLTWYVRDMAAYRASLKAIGRLYRDILGPHYPAMALVEVVNLVEPDALIEIEATAVVGTDRG
jgi:enamine deaminase RidA (YjgF/YER057c/UK114 family)